MARRSARLSNRDSATPKRVSLSHDEIKIPRTLPARLAVLHEGDELPAALPDSPLDNAKQARLSSTRTPSKTTPLKPSSQEMHPQHHQQSTAKPLDEARHLGFSNMGAYTAPPKQTSRTALLQCTPSKSHGIEHDNGSPSFRFTFHREHSLELSPQAKKLMNEKREEAAKIRQQMIADGQGLETVDAMLERKIAIPKSQKSRYGQAHQAQFDKMDSIAGHASAFRANPSHTALRTSTPTTKPKQVPVSSNPKSLKRSPSKAGLDEPEQSPTRLTPRFARNTIASSSTPQPHGSSRRRGLSADNHVQPSTAKRVKIAESEDVSAAKHQAASREVKLEQKLPTKGSSQELAPAHEKGGMNTPTKNPQSRTPNRNAPQISRIPGPASAVTRPTGHIHAREQQQSTEPESPLMSRSPAKTNLFARPSDPSAQAPSILSPLLSRTPLKPEVLKKRDAPRQDDAGLQPGSTPLFARSPTKSASPKKSDVAGDSGRPTAPLLTQSPVRGLFGRVQQADQANVISTGAPLFAKSPSRHQMPATSDGCHTPGKPSLDEQIKSMSRPKLLQVSPMKSILRSPQRLFSDDPAKVAAGTHFSTPPPHRGGKNLFATAATPNTAQKRVDFTSSTKAGEEPSSRDVAGACLRESPSSKSVRETARAVSSSVIEYPTLPTDFMPPSPSPQKRRLTCGPQDFTFRAGDHDIIFGPSPHAPRSAKQTKEVSTIRHVPSEAAVAPTPVTGSKKRKFDFENIAAADAELNGESSDKENTPAPAIVEDASRPVKRTKLNSIPRESKANTSARRPTAKTRTLGVKPKQDNNSTKKRSNAITQSRLNALAQPKRRN